MVKKINSDNIMVLFAYVMITLVGIVAVFPLLYVVSVSLTPYSEYLRNTGIMLFPKKITLTAYKVFLSESTIPGAFRVSIFITIVGTAVNLIVTFLMAYALSRKTLPGRRQITF
jgi:putative aldouronate transport system permease protein